MPQLFFEGDRFVNEYTKKIGTVKSLRDDQYEKIQRLSNIDHYYYSVNYDDGSFETYECQQAMTKIAKNENVGEK